MRNLIRILTLAGTLLFLICGCLSDTATDQALPLRNAEPDEVPGEYLTGIGDGDYIFVDSFFVGCWKNGWFSLEDDKIQFTANDFFMKPRFYLYSGQSYIGESHRAEFYTFGGNAGYEKVRPYVENALIDFPFQLPPELQDISLPEYGTVLYFETPEQQENGPGRVSLATTRQLSEENYAPIIWHSGAAADEKDCEALNNLLKEHGIDDTANYTDIAQLPDGSRILFAGRPFDEDGNIPLDEANGFSNIKSGYAIILHMQADGRYQTVFESYQIVDGDVTGLVQAVPAGIYDLNDDGNFEICIWLRGWEGGGHEVFSQDADGNWITVLSASYGT